MVYRVYVEKKEGFDSEASALLKEAVELLGISGLKRVRVIDRYDVEGVSAELFEYAKTRLFSEPRVETASEDFDAEGGKVLAVEYLPGQYDQKVDSAAQCLQIISGGPRPALRSAKLYVFYGSLDDEDVDTIKRYIVNPVESQEASMELPRSLEMEYDEPKRVERLCGFCELDREALEDIIAEYGLAMDLDDILFFQDYFRSEGRVPTVTELRMVDTYWSDHCRHTTFSTVIENASFEDAFIQRSYEEYLKMREELGRSNKPICLMDLATIVAKDLSSRGLLPGLDESEEKNACTVKIEVEADGKKEPWLLLFKNETHNHPTEIEPFGGASTCVGGAIRDPLSGRAYVYAAMRVTGGGNPLAPISETLEGKLPQRRIVTTAAAGNSSYANQIGLASGIADEIYHPGYVAKRMEVGALIAAAPADNVVRETPIPGDVVILLGGNTGRDGIGAAAGSSKAHELSSLESCGAEVQKGNAPEERKILRLFRNGDATRMIKRCNDFGAGGVSVAIGELADGLDIDLNAVPTKYEGLDGTEIAISESQERMAVVVAKEDVEPFLALAAAENLQAAPVALVKEEPRLSMSWNGDTIVDISREFLNSAGASKYSRAHVVKAGSLEKKLPEGGFVRKYEALADDLNCCSKRGIAERFDASVGAGTVLMPFGGKMQRTPIQAMAHKIPMEKKHTDCCSLMSWGFNPYISEVSPYHGAYLAVVESVSKLIATGGGANSIYLSFQEYFQKLGNDPKNWGKPLAALLGAFRAQNELGIAAIGGKDSMSGTFENLSVPPTLISFAVTTAKASQIVSPEFKAAGNLLVRVAPKKGADGLPEAESLKKCFEKVQKLLASGAAVSCYTPGSGGIAEAVLKMAMGNGFGFEFESSLSPESLFGYDYASFLLELKDMPEGAELIGRISAEPVFGYGNENIELARLMDIYEEKLESVFSCNIEQDAGPMENFTFKAESRVAPAVKTAAPRALIPVLPGTNGEYDAAKALEDAGIKAEFFVVRNLRAEEIAQSAEGFAEAVRDAQLIVLPAGFSGEGEPDKNASFVTAFFRNAAVRESVNELLERRDGLMLGIAGGFEAMLKLGLLPYGSIKDIGDCGPMLTVNKIGRHQSRIVKLRVASNLSPWLAFTEPGEIYSAALSCAEGRFVADEETIRKLAAAGQIATQYVDDCGNAGGDIRCNPNGSAFAVEGISSPDGRVLGRTGHPERVGSYLYKNVPGNYDMKMFLAAAKYFK
ncbi:MAG: phosphoribosylformylglycinamidine synthase [Clostridiales bacterium]|nr:phosphoribosylformylglycinamidine synthase [Clostridiales bacterium]